MLLIDAPGHRAIHNEDFCSIAVTSFNRHDRLENLIDSIHKYADMPFEISVSDDGGARYDTFDFIKRIRLKVSHVAVNVGRNKGLHINTNTAVCLTRSKYVFSFYEDVEILAPFMRKTVNLLKAAPHVGIVYLDHRASINHSKIWCRTPTGQRYSVFCHNGSEWSIAFRRSYWEEVGGYAEDDIYGDLPFNNRGWLKGYFSCNLEGESTAKDMDKVRDSQGHWRSYDTSGKFIDGGYANYPKIFGISDDKLRKMDAARIYECSQWNHIERTADREASEKEEYDPSFYQVGCRNWKRYIEEVLKDGTVNWELLQTSHHARFIEALKRDFESVELIK